MIICVFNFCPIVVMGFGRIAGVLSVVIAALALVLANLDKHQKYTVLSPLLYYPSRLAWKSGFMYDKMIKKIDDTNFRLLGDASSVDEFMGWEVGSEDVIIVTFPKSGTHYGLQMALQSMSEASEDTAEIESIHHWMVLPELLTSKSVAPCNDPKILHMLNHRELAPLGKGTLFGTHLDYGHTPHNKDAKYVVMARDPVAVLLSLQSMIGKILGRLGPQLEELAEMLQLIAGGWAEYNLEWWKHRHETNVLYLFYEDAVQDPVGTVQTLRKFLGKSSDEAVEGRIVERSNAAYMKKRHKAFDPPVCKDMLPIQAPTGGESVMVNKAKAKVDSKQVPSEVRKRIRDYCQRVFAGTDFPITKWPGCQ